MTDQHRATPEDWEYIRLRAEDGVGLLNCILELRARVEALEAAQLEQAESHRFCTDAIVRRVEALEAPTPEPRPASAEAQPAGGLVERVMTAIERADGDHEARAAIREVAEWLRTSFPGLAEGWAHHLEQKATNG
jgi:hypothetical protein